MSCFGDTSGDGGYSGVMNESLADSSLTAATGVPGQTFVAKKICGGKKRKRAVPYYADNRTFDPYSENYDSPALNENFQSPTLDVLDYEAPDPRR